MDTDEIFRSSVEAARRSVAAKGLHLCALLGQIEDIRIIFSEVHLLGRSDSKSSSRIIEPLTASQFIKNSTLQSKRRKRKVEIPASIERIKCSSIHATTKRSSERTRKAQSHLKILG